MTPALSATRRLEDHEEECKKLDTTLKQQTVAGEHLAPKKMLP